MEKSELTLKKMSDTLRKPAAKPVKVDYEGFKAKLDGLKQLDPSLVTLFRMCDEITRYISQQKQVETVTKQLAADLQSLTNGLHVNLRRIDSVQSGLQERIDRFSLLEAKYSRMITRVNGVLDELERVLRQM